MKSIFVAVIPLLLPLPAGADHSHENCHHPSHFAESCVDHPDAFPENLRSLQAFVSGFHWGTRHADACENVKGSHEYYSEPLYKNLFTGAPITRAVGGMLLRGTQEELDLFTGMLGNRPPSDWKSRAAGCDTVVCVLTKLTGSKDGAYRSLIVGKRDGYLVSFDQKDNPSKDPNDPRSPLVEQLWTDKEIRLVEQGLAKLPASFRRLPTLTSILRYPDGYRPRKAESAAAAAYAPYYAAGQTQPGRILLFDDTFHTSNYMKSQSFLIHEVFHHRDFSERSRSGTEFSEKREFHTLSGWQAVDRKMVAEDKRVQNGQAYLAKSTHPFVREYAKELPIEDFAESGAHFILAPDLLQRTDPAKYQWFKERVLEGQEFKAVKWPELDATVQMAGGWAKAFAACTAAPQSYHPQRDGVQVNWPDPNKKADRFLYYTENPSALLPHCLNGFARELVEENPFLCAQLNGDEIVHYLSLRMMPEINAIETALEGGALYRARDLCEKSADFSSECVSRHLLSAVHAGPGAAGLSSRTGSAPENLSAALDSLGAKFRPSTSVKESLDRVEAKASATEAYARCVLHRAANGGGDNLFELRLFAPGNASGEPMPGCWSEAARFLDERGVKLGASLKASWQSRLQFESAGFEQGVVIAYLRRSSSECRGNSACKSDLAAHLAGTWASSKGLPQAAKAAVVGLARRSAR